MEENETVYSAEVSADRHCNKSRDAASTNSKSVQTGTVIKRGKRLRLYRAFGGLAPHQQRGCKLAAGLAVPSKTSRSSG
jgi:hypothetical protein